MARSQEILNRLLYFTFRRSVMDLSLDIICDNLPESLNAQRFGPESAALSLGFPMFYENGREFEKNRLYIARSGSWPKEPPKRGLSVVYFDANPPQEWLDGGCHILLIPGGFSLFLAVNEIYKIYEKFGKWESALRNALEDEERFDIKKIIKLGATILENPVSVTNGNMLNIFATDMTGGAESGCDIRVNEYVRDAEQSGSILDGFELIKDACRLERVIKEPYLSQNVVNGYRYYCYNLYYPSGYYAGCASIRSSNRPFRDSDFALADYFFTYLYKAYEKYLRRASPVEYAGVAALKNLLDDIPLSAQERKELTLDGNERWIFFKLGGIRKMNYLPVEYMYTTLNTLIPGKIYAVISENTLLGLIRVEDGKDVRSQSVLGDFEECVSRMGYVAGLSCEFYDLKHINVYVKQAAYAAEAGGKLYPDAYTHYFRSHILQYILTRYNGSFPPELLYPEGLRALIEHDRNSGAEYVNTLYVFLKNETRATITAEELFLHRSSLLNRLDKVKKLLRIDLEDPDVRLYLRICLYMLRNGARRLGYSSHDIE
jgi:hypothetical protein